MKMMLLAAAAALTLGSASAAFADGGDLTPDTQFTLQQRQPQPIQSQPSAVARQANGNTAIYATQSHNNGTWLFPPDALGGGEN
jgi:hypothetical protein